MTARFGHHLLPRNARRIVRGYFSLTGERRCSFGPSGLRRTIIIGIHLKVVYPGTLHHTTGPYPSSILGCSSSVAGDDCGIDIGDLGVIELEDGG